MRAKARHLLHPLRSARTARTALRDYLARRRFAGLGRKHFAGDSRYRLAAVTEGFANRLGAEADDRAILQRICSAYRRALSDEPLAPEAYKPTGWWQMQRHGSLQPVMGALANGDIEALQRMYRNFYRDPCSAGLTLVQSLARQYFGGAMQDHHRRYILADTLHRVDHWKRMLPGNPSLATLAGPDIGNPFGVMIDRILVRHGAEYQHFCATRVKDLLEDRTATVAEIGGGYGGMAFYLLRDCPEIKYLDFDVPESIALASYFLMRAFPSRRFLLYGEETLGEEAWERADIALLPAFALRTIPLKANVVFSSHAISDLSKSAQEEYAARLSAMRPRWHLSIGDAAGMTALDRTLENTGIWSKTQDRDIAWHGHRNANAQEIERLYQRRT